MSMLADLTVRSSLVVLLGLLFVQLLHRRSAATRHAVMAGAILAAAAVGPLSAALPQWNVPAPGFVRTAALPSTPEVVAVASADRSASVDGVEHSGGAATSGVPSFAVVWTAGFIGACALLAVGLLRLAWIANHARNLTDSRWTTIARHLSAGYGLKRAVTLLQTDASDLVATYGLWHPRLLLPADAHTWSDERIRVVLCHELAHVRRHDWAVQIGAELVRSVYWFNPLLWIACRSLRRESEQACDDVVLANGVQAPDYAAHLLDLARIARPRGSAWASGMPMIRPSMLERRIAAMLNPAVNRHALSSRAIAATIVLLVAIATPIAVVRAGQSGPLPLAGTIYDDSGGVLPGVELMLEDSQQFKWQATTDASGRFEFPPVQPGRYVLEATLPGFRTLRNEFTLRSTRDWDRAITLGVGELQETITVSAQRPAAASVPSSAQPQRIRVGGNIRPPRKLINVNPVYPATMREAGREGTVPIQAIIGVDGSVTSLRVLGAEIHPDFAKAAADAVRQWKFTPTLLNGAAVEVVMKVEVTFSLSE